MQIHRTGIIALLLLVMGLTMARPAAAGLADTPVPELRGEKAQHVYSVTGVKANWGTGIGTLFTCTSTEKTREIILGVEIFDDHGSPLNDISADELVLEVDPGETVTVGTISTPTFSVDETTSGVASPGSARILATSNKIICCAMTVTDDYPPTAMMNLPVFRKTKQRGD